MGPMNDLAVYQNFLLRCPFSLSLALSFYFFMDASSYNKIQSIWFAPNTVAKVRDKSLKNQFHLTFYAFGCQNTMFPMFFVCFMLILHPHNIIQRMYSMILPEVNIPRLPKKWIRRRRYQQRYSVINFLWQRFNAMFFRESSKNQHSAEWVCFDIFYGCGFFFFHLFCSCCFCVTMMNYDCSHVHICTYKIFDKNWLLWHSLFGLYPVCICYTMPHFIHVLFNGRKKLREKIMPK